MAKPLLPDELWVLIQPLIPPHPPQPEGGRPFLDDRKVLTGIIFILKTGLPWGGLASGDGLWLRHDLLEPLGDWQAAGVWDQIHQILLNHLRSADRIDFERFIVDTSHVCAVGGGEETGPAAPSIARNWAANTRFSPTVKACPWSSIPSRRTLRTPIRPCRWWMPFLRSPASRAPPPETPGPCDGGPGL